MYVSNSFQVKPGARINDNLFVGRGLGVGLQGGVFLLEDGKGHTDPHKVLKATFKWSLGGIAGMTHMEREWQVGRALSALENTDKGVPGFMATGAAVVTKSGVFRGFILERIHGANSDKRVGNPAFHDITYIRQLLFSVFKSLHAAQRQLAFHHADLRLANIMELIDPDSAAAGLASRTTSSSASSTSQSPSPTQRNSLEANQRSSLDKDSSRPAPAVRSKSVNSIPAVNLKPTQQQALEWSDSLTHHFKIIDYGLADFKELFGAGYVRSRSGHHTRKEHKTSGGLFRGTSLGKMAVPVKVIDSKDVDPADKEYMRSARPVGCVALLPHPSKLLPQVAPIEQIYRYFWKRKGDVYALLWDLQRFLDGRVWPVEDELEVRLMIDLIRHVTGVRLKAYFVPLNSATDKDGVKALKLQRQFSPLGAFKRNDGALHVLRIRAIRLRSWFKPHNPGITAAEALTSPFFTYQYDTDFTPSI